MARTGRRSYAHRGDHPACSVAQGNSQREMKEHEGPCVLPVTEWGEIRQVNFVDAKHNYARICTQGVIARTECIVRRDSGEAGWSVQSFQTTCPSKLPHMPDMCNRQKRGHSGRRGSNPQESFSKYIHYRKSIIGWTGPHAAGKLIRGSLFSCRCFCVHTFSAAICACK